MPIRRRISAIVTPPPPSSSMTVGIARNTNIAQIAPTMPALHAKPQEVALELAGDEAVRGADEVQHLDDLAVGRHGALGGRDDDGGGGGADQQQDGEAAEREGARDGADLLLPAAVVVERHALELLAERRPHRVQIRRVCARSSSTAMRRGTGSVLAAHRSVPATARAAGPHRRRRARARWRCPAARDRKRVTSATTLSTSRRFLGLDLHRHLAGDVAQPGRRPTGSSCRRRPPSGRRGST